MRVRVLDDSKHRGPFFGVSGKEVKNGKVQRTDVAQAGTQSAAGRGEGVGICDSGVG